MSTQDLIDLDFSHKYDLRHAQDYLSKHQDGLLRRLSNRRDQQIARKALKLAGDPGLVLDLPCGAGRFWPLLCEQPNRVVLAADNSPDMIATARSAHAPALLERVHTFQTSAFAIDLHDSAVDCIFCIRLLHHIEKPQHRQAILQEFHRVSRDTVIVSLWVDGNYKAWKRRRLERHRAVRGDETANRNRFIVSRAVIEQEFMQAGFEVLAHLDFLPRYAMWRTYVLRKTI